MRIWRSTDPEPSDSFAAEQVYNALDCCVTREVLDELLPQLNERTSAVYDFERELQAPILEMMLRGIAVDMEARSELIALYQKQLLDLQTILDEILTEGLGVGTINPGSWQQKQHLLYDVLGLPHVRKRGKITTDRSALEKLSTYFHAEPICRCIMACQDVRKKLGFLKTGLDPDNRCRTTFGIAGTDTGRLSSYGSCWFTGTNMQNIAPEMRKMFIADPGMKLAYIDLEQAEARLLGGILWNLFHDGKYLDFCESGDLHTNVTMMTWQHLGWSEDAAANKTIAKANFYREFTYRDASKRLGHASNYHGQPPQISREVRIPVGLVTEFQHNYFREFPAIARWHDYVRTKLLRDGWLTSLMGRPRWFFGRRWENETVNAAIAYDPQSSIADYLNRGLVSVWADPLCNKLGCQILLQVHDALLIQYPESAEAAVVPRVQSLLEMSIPLFHGRSLTIPTEALVGWNWGYAYNDKKELVNPNGLVAFGNDKRVRTSSKSFLDRELR
jgi:DNA polymerase-1